VVPAYSPELHSAEWLCRLTDEVVTNNGVEA
jgi:hypothetical protein